MRSLQYLNNVSSNLVNFTDNRSADVIFDRFPKDYQYTFTQSSFSLYVATEIIEIIDPANVNLRYKINISGDVDLDFGPLPNGVGVSESGSVYTVYGIDSISDWDAVKSPTVTLDPNYFGDVNYTVTFIYDTPAQANITLGYDVNTFVPQADLQATSTISCSSTVQYDSSIDMPVIFNINSEIIPTIQIRATIRCQSTVAYISPAADILSESTISSSGTNYRGFLTRIDVPTNISENSGKAIDVKEDKLFVAEDTSTYGTPNYVTYIYDLPAGTVSDSIQSSFDLNDPYSVAYSNHIDGSDSTEFVSVAFGFPGSSGSNEVYYKDLGDTSWTKSTASTGDSRTAAVDSTNNYLLVPLVLDTSVNSSLAFVYSLDINHTLTLEHNITDPTGGAGDGDIGKLSDISDDYFVIAGTTSADIYIYDTATGNADHTFTPSFNPRSICLYKGKLAVAGASQTIVYDIDTQQTVETYSQGVPSWNITQGHTVSLSDELIAIADSEYDIDGTGQQSSNWGEVYLYRRDNYTLHKTLQNPDLGSPLGYDHFGRNVKLTSDYIVITASNEYEGNNNIGQIYIYK